MVCEPGRIGNVADPPVISPARDPSTRTDSLSAGPATVTSSGATWTCHLGKKMYRLAVWSRKSLRV